MLEEKEEILNDDEDYINTIKELKENSVSKDEYNKLRNRNKQLLETLKNGQSLEEKFEKKPDIEQIKARFLGYRTNLDYVKDVLELRNAVIESGKPDPFLPLSKRFAITQDDINSANKTAKILQECVDESKGSSELFTALFKDRLVDNKIR